MTLKPSARGAAALTWAKSSYSANEPDSACVEVATCTCEGILVRDSKDPEGPHLCFTPDSWNAFVAFAVAATV